MSRHRPPARRPRATVRVVFITAAHERQALAIARALIRERAAACVSCVARVRSLFRWQGRVDECRETLLIVKTTAARFPAVQRIVRRLHTYEVPEVLALPVVAGHRAYVDWVVTSCTPLTRSHSS